MKTKVGAWGILCAWAFLGVAPSQAPTPRYTLSGRVQRITGEPVSDALVQLYNENWAGKPLFSGSSDARGGFRFEKIPAGRYLIRIMKPGYEPIANRVTMAANVPPLSFTLRPANPDGAGDWNVSGVLRAKGGTREDRGKAGDAPTGQDRSGRASHPKSARPAAAIGSWGVADLYTGPETAFTYEEPAGRQSRFVITGVVASGQGNKMVFRSLNRYRLSGGEPVQALPGGAAGRTAPLRMEHAAVSAPALAEQVLDTLNPIRSINAGIQERFHIDGSLSVVYAFDFLLNDPQRRALSVSPKFQVFFEPTRQPTFRFSALPGEVSGPGSGDKPFSAGFSAFPTPAPGPGGALRAGNDPRLPSGLTDTQQFKTFLDEIAATGRSFVAIFKRPNREGFRFSNVEPKVENSPPGIIRFDLSRQWANALPSSVIYVYGAGSREPARTESFASPSKTLEQSFFNAFSAAFNSRIPEPTPEASSFRPQDAALLKPAGPSLSPFQGHGDRSFGLFLREATPLTEQSPGNWNTVFDMRLLMGYGVKAYETPSGDLILVYTSRTSP